MFACDSRWGSCRCAERVGLIGALEKVEISANKKPRRWKCDRQTVCDGSDAVDRNRRIAGYTCQLHEVLSGQEQSLVLGARIIDNPTMEHLSEPVRRTIEFGIAR